MRAIVLAMCLAGLPVADDDPAKSSSTSSSTETPPIIRFSEPATPQGSTSAPTSSTSEPGAEAPPKSPASEAPKKPTATRKQEIVPESKKVIDEVREETSEMLELERIRAIRDETQIMLELHDKNVVDIETKLSELEAARQKLDRARSALEETLTRKSKIDDDKEKERRRIRLLLSSGQMKPKKIAALMEQISVEESRVLLEALPEATAKAVLEALPSDRLALIVGQSRASTKPPETGATP